MNDGKGMEKNTGSYGGMAAGGRTGTGGGEGGGGWLAGLAAWPMNAIRAAIGKWQGFVSSHSMAAKAEVPRSPEAALGELKRAWRKLEPAASPGVPGADMETALPLGSWVEDAGGPNDAELSVIHRIREETVRLNRNNVTRTEAYRAVYRRHPELHWALLAHLVSRNGGWNMTDLRGELLPRLLRPEQREAVFRMLERANALIFQDAYPQLLLYETGKRFGRDLSRLLPAFGVSGFMGPVWSHFWRTQDSAVLTTALIVNEQHYIEGRVVRHPYYRERVLDTLFFGLQSLLQLNQVIVPYRIAGEVHGSGMEGLRLMGRVVSDFSDLRERIRIGRQLYAILFGVPDVREGAHRFAAEVRHTGSRADYAPHIFAQVRKGVPERTYRERLAGSRLRAGADPLYSPALTDVWPDRLVEPAEPGDWFRSADEAAAYFSEEPLPALFDLTGDYWYGMGKLELAAATASELGSAFGK